jgi:hypothetical protein
MIKAGASQSLMKIEAVETATIPMGRRMKRESILYTYIN